jgi:Winged helix DNA-binding domain
VPTGTSNSKTATEPPDCSPSIRKRTVISPSLITSSVLVACKQALNYLLGHLERSGYLEREPDPDDQRSRRIAVTARGTAAIRVIRQAVAEVETSWADQFGRERFAQLRTLLLELNQLA